MVYVRKREFRIMANAAVIRWRALCAKEASRYRARDFGTAARMNASCADALAQSLRAGRLKQAGNIVVAIACPAHLQDVERLTLAELGGDLRSCGSSRL